MKQENIPIIIVVIVITALVVSGGMYWWRQSTLEKINNETKQQINELQQQIDNLTKEKSDLQQQINKITEEKIELQQQINELTKEEERYVRIVSPNGGETICLDGEFVIEWESKGVDTVSVRVIKKTGWGGTSFYYLGLDAVPATFNEESEPGKGLFVWEVGKTSRLQEGYGYRLEITSADSGTSVSDTSDNVFSIIICKG